MDGGIKKGTPYPVYQVRLSPFKKMQQIQCYCCNFNFFSLSCICIWITSLLTDDVLKVMIFSSLFRCLFRDNQSLKSYRAYCNNETNSKMRKINRTMYLHTAGMQKGKMESDEACYDVTKGLQSNKHLCQHSNTHTKTRFFRLESLLFKSSLGRAIKKNVLYLWERL